MFTGIVEKVSQVRGKRFKKDGIYLEIRNPFDELLKQGSSIAVNGACLTVVSSDMSSFMVYAGTETLSRTNLGVLSKGEPVNLERPIKLGDRLDGHFLLGHIDTTGLIRSRTLKGDGMIIRIAYPREYSELVIEKGSIGVDGISLTIIEPSDESFGVFLVPYTISNTTLGVKPVGAAVNIEFDMVVKSIKGFKGYGEKARNFLY